MRAVEFAATERWTAMAEEMVGLGYWRLDADTRAIQWSANMYRIFGFDPSAPPTLEEAMSRIHPADSEAVNITLEQALVGSDGPTRSRLVMPDGSIRFIEGRNGVERDAAGRVVAVFGTTLDVTDRTLAESKVIERERRYRLLTDNATDIIFSLKPDGTVIFVSPAISRILGHDPADTVGRRLYDLVHPDDRDRVRAAFLTFLDAGADGRLMRFDYRAIGRDGRIVWVEGNPRAIVDPATDAIVEIQDCVRDISARKALEGELVLARDAAQAAVTVKAELLANLSHELRTPLTAIIGHAGLLSARASLPADIRRSVDLINDASQILQSAVNGVLDFSRIEAGRMSIRPVASSPRQLAEQCVRLFSQFAEQKGLALSFVGGETLPDWVSIDPDAFRQVLVNLVGNAIKFTARGRVQVSASYAADSLEVRVADTGPGIDPAKQAKLFQRFSQIDGSLSRNHTGAGLGLAICKGLVEAMGGAISVQSALGEGATFAFSIPSPVTGAAADAQRAGPITGARILIVDDNASARDVVVAALTNAGATVVEASDGRSGLECAIQAPFDLILLDIRMSGTSGAEVASILRSRHGPNRNAPIIAFTAEGEGAGAADLQQQGFDGLLRKPVSIETLLGVVGSFVQP